MLRPITSAVWLTRSSLNAIKQRSLLIEIDQVFLAQIQRILPATLAGFCVWTGEHEDAPYVRWHWYFDAELKQFVIPQHGIVSNLVLTTADGRQSLPHAALARHVLRRIRRRQDWQPWLQLHALSRSTRVWPPPAKKTERARDAQPPALIEAPHAPPWADQDLAIIGLIKKGSLRKEIAALIGISTATVDRRIADIKARLGVGSMAKVAEAAVKLGLV